VSLSDVLTPLGWTSTQVIWELRMEQLDGDRCRYTNTVTSHPTDAVVPLRAYLVDQFMGSGQSCCV
jgi:hypothetical protein